MAYLYETHLHTSVGSKCSSQTPEEQLRRFQYYGYTGVFITDHFLNGNTTVDRSLPWEDAICAYCRAYEEACEVGARIGIDVFFGFESSYAGNDVLTYGLGKDWLLAHPEIMDLSMRAYCEFARSERLPYGFRKRPRCRVCPKLRSCRHRRLRYPQGTEEALRRFVPRSLYL